MREIKSVADVQQIPQNEWIVFHSKGGKCLYCGKDLPVYRDCCIRYGACDCEVAKAVKEHNDKIISK